jgi:phosphoglycerate dehydrogenase-like enzyme
VAARTRVAAEPFIDDGLRDAIEDGGAVLVQPPEADGLIWTNPGDPEGLKKTLQTSPARWVQLPFAGIESFVEAGVLDPSRTWTCTKGAYGRATAEHALALMLCGARLLHWHARARRWRDAGLGLPEFDLKDRVAVIVGTGGIGTHLTAMLMPLEARVIGVNRSGRPLEGAEQTVTVASLGDVIGDADFVVLAAAATPETKHLLNEEMLTKMRSSAWLINVARGSLVDTNALVGVLTDESIAGAALDVTDPEPLAENHPLWAMDNVIITPHIANTWDMALPELRNVVRRNVKAFAQDRPLEGVVDVKLGY